MARLPLKNSTIKKLFALSGNRCAFPDCPENIVDKEGTLLGEICHIEAAEKGGERYNKKSNDEYRRSFENLILMCDKHHKTTNNVSKYPPGKLKSFKQDHENKYLNKQYHASKEIIEEAIINVMKQKNKNSDRGTQINNQASVQNIGTQIGVQNIKKYAKSTEAYKIKGARPIIQKFKSDIDSVRKKASPPKETVIDFRNDLSDKHPRDIESIPFNLLKFRKANGRIKAEVDSYEKLNGLIDEKTQKGQMILGGFLRDIDKDKNESLKQQIRHKTQLQEAIITCDGFLINGNRRRLIIEELYNELHQDSKFENMRVVVLPENISEIDILKIENRYQLQDEGKSEYHGLNRALTMRDNENASYSLEAQIHDDPKFHDLKGREFDTVVKKFRSDFLQPLECIDRYLKLFQREGIYTTISESVGDREGRWQAFIDYSKFYNSTLTNERIRLALGIEETEIRKIEDAIFKLIRKRSLNSKGLELTFGKLHQFLRGGNLKKYLVNPEAKKYLFKIAESVPSDLPAKDKKDKKGNAYDYRKLDELWGAQNEKKILGNLSQAFTAVHEKEESDKPAWLIESAYKKLNHKGFSVENIDSLIELAKAETYIELISKKVVAIKKELKEKRKDLE